MDDWLEASKLRTTYRLCAAGFALVAASMLLVCLDVGLWIVLLVVHPPALRQLMGNPDFEFFMSTAITWGSVIGMYLLWGRWQDPPWRRRAGLLVVMGAIDLLLWLARHGPVLGLPGTSEHEWLRMNVGMAFGWAEFGILASLAFQTVTHGKAIPYVPPPSAEEAMWSDHPSSHHEGQHGYRLAPAARRALMPQRPSWHVAAIGFAFWAVAFVWRTNWQHPWPLAERPLPMGETLLLIFLTHILWMSAAWWVTLLSWTACRRCAAEAEARSDHRRESTTAWSRSESNEFDDVRDKSTF